MMVGVDPVATITGISKGDGISHFALAKLLKTPYNTVIVADGIIEKCDALQGEEHIVETQRTFSKTHQGTSIESNGAGVVFIGMITRNNAVKIHPHQVSELGQGNKKDRQYKFLQPLFASRSVLVSKASTPFLDAVREYLDTFPNFDADSHLWDIGDAIAIGILDIPGIWSQVVTKDVRDNIWEKPKMSMGSAWNALGG